MDDSSGTTTGAAAEPAGKLPGGRARPKTGKSEQTRALILQTAMRLFRERGYDRTTMRAIAQEAGVSVGNAYYYFESKEKLLISVVEAITCPTCHGAGKILPPLPDLHEHLPPGDGDGAPEVNG